MPCHQTGYKNLFLMLTLWIIATYHLIPSEHCVSPSGVSGFLKTNFALDLSLLELSSKESQRRKCKAVIDTVFAELHLGCEQS